MRGNEQKGEANAYRTVAERMIRSGSDGSMIAAFTGYDRKHIDSIAREMKMPVTWNELRA